VQNAYHKLITRRTIYSLQTSKILGFSSKNENPWYSTVLLYINGIKARNSSHMKAKMDH
jgi:hypothetical protein